MSENLASGSDRSLRPFAAHLQGIAVGIVLSYVGLIDLGGYVVGGTFFVLFFGGYVIERRERNAVVRSETRIDDE